MGLRIIKWISEQICEKAVIYEAIQNIFQTLLSNTIKLFLIHYQSFHTHTDYQTLSYTIQNLFILSNSLAFWFNYCQNFPRIIKDLLCVVTLMVVAE